LDRFIGNGDALSFCVWPHRHKVALFRDLTPELADWIRRETPQAVTAVWDTFTRLYATWWLVGEERQVHFGENLFDPPDLALGAFQALAWLRGANPDQLARHVDRPFARADLYHLTKLALALETEAIPIRIYISLVGQRVRITWEGGGRLESAPEVTGPWAEVTGAVSGSEFPVTNTRQFYRVRR